MAAPAAPSAIDLVELGPHDLPLLRRLFRTMQSVFGEDELDEVETFEAELSGSHPNCRLLCVVALGEQPAAEAGAANGGGDVERPIIGGALWEYFLKSECFLYTYLFLNPDMAQGRGTGRLIANEMWAAVKRRERAEGLRNRGVFVEMHDPMKVEDAAADAMDPFKRVEMFQHMGVRQVGRPAFSYFQPPLQRDEGQPLSEVEHSPFLLGLVVTRRTERDTATGAPFVSAQTLRDFVTAYYADCAGADFESDPYYQRMISSLHGHEQLPLVDFDCLSAPKVALKPQPVRSLPHIGTVRVVVVGAGLAGLACARMLQEEGGGRFQVTVLEARDRVGGRVHTHCVNGMQVDLGASWLHGLRGNVLADIFGLGSRLTSSSTVKLCRTEYSKTLMYDGAHGPLSSEEALAAGVKIDALMQCLEKDAESLRAVCNDSAEQALKMLHQREIADPCTRRHKVALNYMLSKVESENAACLDELSAKFLPDDTELPGGDHLFLGGAANAVVPAVRGAAWMDVQLQRAVRAVQYRDKGEATHRFESPVVLNVEDLASGHNSEVECDAVVLTIPIGVLQAGDSGICFQPPLPAWKANAVQGVGNGLFNKVALRWEHADIFWPAESHMLGFNIPLRQGEESEFQWAPLELETRQGLPLHRENLWIVNMLPVDGQPVLIAMVTGTLAKQMQSMTEEEMVHRVVAALRTMFGPDVPMPCASAVSRWDQDEFARGSYSFVKKGWRGDVDFDALVAPLGCGHTSSGVQAAGLVFFAGEATSAQRFGYMDGAVETGRREARRLIQMYRADLGEAGEAPLAAEVRASKL